MDQLDEPRVTVVAVETAEADEVEARILAAEEPLWASAFLSLTWDA